MQKVVLGLKRLPEWSTWRMTVKIGDHYDEGPSAEEDNLCDIVGTAKATLNHYVSQVHEVEITKSLQKAFEEVEKEGPCGSRICTGSYRPEICKKG